MNNFVTRSKPLKPLDDPVSRFLKDYRNRAKTFKGQPPKVLDTLRAAAERRGVTSDEQKSASMASISRGIDDRLGGPLSSALIQAAMLGIPGYYIAKNIGASKGVEKPRMAGLLAGASLAAIPLWLKYPMLRANYVGGGIGALNAKPNRVLVSPEQKINSDFNSFVSRNKTRMFPEPEYKQLKDLTQQFSRGSIGPMDAMSMAARLHQGVKKSGAMTSVGPSVASWENRPYDIRSFDSNQARFQIAADPYLSPFEKATANSMISRSEANAGKISASDFARAAIGAGVGWGAGALAGKVLSGVFGGLPKPVSYGLQATGLIAGLLRGTGIMR